MSVGEKKRKFEKICSADPAPEFVCPVCYELLHEPIRLRCSHVFCWICLSKWLASNDGKLTCPLDRTAPDGLPSLIDEALQQRIVSAHPEESKRRHDYVEAEKRLMFRDVVDFLRTRSHVNARLVTNLKRSDSGVALESGSRLENALLSLPRGEFVPPLFRCQAYSMNHALHVTSLQYYMSPALQQVQSLLLLDIQAGHSVLNVGTGGGLVAALAAQMTTEVGVVHGIDVRPVLVDFARDNILAQSARVSSAQTMRRTGESNPATVYRDFLPGVVHEGYLTPPKETRPPHLFYLYADTLEISTGQFTGKVHWPHRGKTVAFCKGRITLCANGIDADIVIRETQVHVTRYTWDQLDWLPAEYSLHWRGGVLSGADSQGWGLACKVVERNALSAAPNFDHVTLHTANVLDPNDMAPLISRLPGGYDRIHCCCECSEESVAQILRYLKVGGVMVTHIAGHMSVVTRTEDGYDVETKGRVASEKLLSVEEGVGRVEEDRRRAEVRAEERARAEGGTYCSRCCGAPLCNAANEIDVSPVIGCSLEVADSTGLLFAPGSAQAGLTLDSADHDYISTPLLSASVAPIRCASCALSVGLRFTRPPPEKRGLFEWRNALLLSSTLVELRGDSDSDSGSVSVPPSPQVQCGNGVVRCAGCKNVLAQSAQLLSCRYRWRTDDTLPLEPAAYFNSLIPGATRHGKPTEMTVSQGRMNVSLLYCADCDAEVGWRFVSHLIPAQRYGLLFHEGRCGLVVSKVWRC